MKKVLFTLGFLAALFLIVRMGKYEHPEALMSMETYETAIMTDSLISVIDSTLYQANEDCQGRTRELDSLRNEVVRLRHELDVKHYNELYQTVTKVVFSDTIVFMVDTIELKKVKK